MGLSLWGFPLPSKPKSRTASNKTSSPWQEGLYLAGYEVLSDTWIWADTLAYAEGFGLGSSTYDHWEDDYVFLGLPLWEPGRIQWMEHPVTGFHRTFSYPTSTGCFTASTTTCRATPSTAFKAMGWTAPGWILATEMVTGRSTTGPRRWSKSLPIAGEVSLEVVLQLPWLEGVVAGASCFDSDTHRFFIWGIDNQGNGRLVAVDCENATVSSDVSPNWLPTKT